MQDLEAGTIEYLEAACTRLLTSLRSKSMTLATAESCTGGLVASLITAVPGSSASYLGSVVSYSNASKQDLLGVDDAELQRWGAVSEVVAQAMAAGARARFGSDIAVSITGIAGPGGGSEEKPVGTVCFGMAGPNGIQSTTQVFPGDRRAVRRAAAGFALERLIEMAEVVAI